MRYHSTRNGDFVSLDDALSRGLAADGGLYLPEDLPRFTPQAFSADTDPQAVARRMLQPFFADSMLTADLDEIVSETFSFPIPVRPLTGRSAGLLELFHGPTAAFKDVGARFLAACLSRLPRDDAAPLTILVATSGDTGGAVAAAFDGRPGTQVVVLYPDGRVSPRQARQLSCWGDNVLTLRVAGSFDDCQALVKAAFADPELNRRYPLTSANSINIGRLLPQACYYAYAAIRHWRDTGTKPGFIVPTGNLGNALAAMLARAMGLPIGGIVLATNANRSIADYFESGDWRPRETVATHATAMDVGNPSNMERLLALASNSDSFAEDLTVIVAADPAIEAAIVDFDARFGVVLCPHTAAAAHAWRRLAPETDDDWILVATAHPAKFEAVVEPLIGRKVELPRALADILGRPDRSQPAPAKLSAVTDAMDTALISRSPEHG